jgi:signal transduction histidine kinase/ActR/RegA family two-component response regulator
MTAEALVRLVTNFLFVLIFVGVARTALRERTRGSFDAALLFGAFALIVAQTQLFSALGTRAPAPVALASAALLLAIPYLLVRLVEDFTELRTWIVWLSLGLCIGLIAGLPFLSSPPALWYLIALGLYFFGFVSYAGIAFAREARLSKGVVGRRMAAASIGSLALGVVILVAVGVALVPIPAAVTMLLALACATAYLVAFAPPALLRRSWREPTLRSFLAEAIAISPLEDRAGIVTALEAAAKSASGVPEASVALWDAEAKVLRIGPGRTIPSGEGLIGSVFHSGRAAFAETGDERTVAGGVEGVRGRALVAAPISTRGQRLGVLVLLARRARLFASDELELAQLLADQTAVVLDGARMYADLTAANRELSEATRVKSEFLANMSHELRTPLNAILGFSGLLSEQLAETLTDRQRRFLRNINEAGEHLLELINEVLDLSKVEAGKVDLHREVLSLAALLEPVVASLTTAAEAKGLTVDIVAPPSMSVFVDPTRVRQVLLNLTSNAVKFTSAGSVRLRALSDGGDIMFEVVDSGVGIPLEAQDRVFGVFERLHEGTFQASGTGLGLALTKRLVELMGGTITFESTAGHGTTFGVRLPDALSQPVSGTRLLIVEDERHDAELVVVVAASLGLRSEVVRTLASAREALARSMPVGIVLDLKLPDGRGEALLDELRRQAVRVPVVVVSVEGEPEKAITLGADDYLTKPIDRARLLTWLGRLDRTVAEPAPRKAEVLRAHSSR